jgi:Ser/Thr protein kinase RdoA (MazF antagonist)
LLTEDEAARVLGLFPEAGRFAGFVAHSSRPLSSAALTRTDRGEVFLKRRPRRSRTEDMLAQEHAFVERLRSRGVSAPAPLRTTDGGTFVADGGFLYEAQPCAEGEDLYAGRHTWQPFLSVEHAESVGRELRRIREAAEGFAPAAPADPGIQSGRFRLAGEGLEGVRRRIGAHPGLAGLLESRTVRLDVLEPFLSRVGPWLRRARRHMAHGDPQANNFFFRDGSVASVIDFHLCAVNPPLFDLAVALDRNGLMWLDILAGRDDAVDWGGIEALLRGYGPLDAEEREVLPDLMAVVQLDFSLELAEYYLELEGSVERAAWCLEAFLVGHTAWHASLAGRGFAARLARLVA